MHFVVEDNRYFRAHPLGIIGSIRDQAAIHHQASLAAWPPSYVNWDDVPGYTFDGDFIPEIGWE